MDEGHMYAKWFSIQAKSYAYISEKTSDKLVDWIGITWENRFYGSFETNTIKDQ